MEKLIRRPSESEFDYHKRLVLGKLVDGTLSDIDYSELASYVYGKEYSSDVARRMFYGSRKTLELLDHDVEASVTADSLRSELDAKQIEIQKERQRFFDQRREYTKLVNAEGRREHLESRLVEAANKLNESVGCLYPERIPLSYDPDSEAVLVLCDWHYGLKTNNVWNSYDTDICIERIRTVVQKAVQKITLHKCSTLHILILGDLIHGAIHTSARVASEELVCDQIMNAAEILAQSINELSRYVDTVNVYMTYGNHARTVQRKEDSIHRDNMERIIPWWLRERLSSNEWVNIMPESEDEFITLDVCGHGVCASHGDLDSVKTSTRLLPTLLKKRCGYEIEYILLADKHHREGFEELGVTSLLCSALCGTDDYANGKRLYSTPGQLLLIFNNEDGIDGEYRLKAV